MPNLRPTEILIILLVIVVIFGAAKLPNIAANLGKSMKVFKKEVKELREDDDKPADPYQATGGVRVEPQQYTAPQGQQFPPAQGHDQSSGAGGSQPSRATDPNSPLS